jgi:hypothetical protein
MPTNASPKHDRPRLGRSLAERCEQLPLRRDSENLIERTEMTAAWEDYEQSTTMIQLFNLLTGVAARTVGQNLVRRRSRCSVNLSPPPQAPL